MARWDEILSLPVQSPPTLEFSSADLVWSKVEGWRDNIDRVALIPFARVDDFVRGESSNKECPTRFHVEARRRRPLEMSYKPKVDGILEYILYWCSFGPDDHRKGGIVRPSRSTYVPKKKSAGRPNTKRGCTCHFIVKRLIAEPSVALIIYNLDKHVDKKGLPCHGPQDKKAAGTRAMFAPYISDDLRLRVLSLLYVGVSVETIMQRHNESVERQGGPCNRDDLLTHRYVRRLERSIRRSTYELDADDAVSISMWVESHQSHVFFYEDFSDSDPFTLGIQTEWQLQQMIRFGNRSLVASDSRFGTNKLKYPIHTLLVFDSDNKAIPVAWIITSRFANGDEHKWIRALYNRVHSKDPTWKLGGFIVDDPSADVITIREVFQCSVLICFWRVRHAWLKNLVKKCSETQMRFEVFRQLGQAIYSICKGNGNVDLFENFMEDFVDCSDFLDYFRAVWFPRIEMWITALKTLPLSSQETCAAIECYHHQLKLRLLNEKDPSVYQRADWLVDKLGTKVHSYFWLDEYAGKDDFARYQKEEWMSGLTSWRRALEIRDSDVVLEGRCAKVISQRDRQKAHVVWNPGSEFAICDCNWSAMGNLCKHVIKVSRVCRDKGSAIPSISLSEYYLTLINMLHCPPHDSLFRDQAVSLAVCVQMQLNALVDLERNQTTMDPIEKQIISESSANKDRDAVNESQHNVENILTSNKNVSEVVDEAQGSVAGDLGGKKVIDQVGDKNDVCCESVEQIIAFGEMDVDPLSTCTSPSAGNNLDGVSFTYGFSENGGSGLLDAGLDMCEDLSSNDNDLIIRNEVRDNMSDKDSHDKVITVAMMDVLEETIIVGMMDVDPQPSKTPMSTLGAAEQHKMTNDNVGCGIVTGSTVNVNLVDCNPQSMETSPSSSLPIDLKSVNVIESTNGVSGIGGMKNESQSMCQNLPPSGDADGVTANEFRECDLIDRLESANGVCGHVSEGTGSVTEVLPRSTNASPSMSKSVELQQLVEFVVNETGVCDSVSERASGNMMNISSQSICISASNLEVKQQTIGQVVSTNDMSENGGDLANDNQDISENLFSTANPSIISCEFHDSIAHGNCSSEVISQLASDDGVCGDDAEGTISVQAIGNCSNEAISQLASDNGGCGDDAEGTSSGLAVQVSPSEKRSSKLPITIDLVTCDVICCSVAEEFVTGNTMDVDAISRQTSPSELEDVGR